jgi:tetratricopeptide (TPR) repeat protein
MKLDSRLIAYGASAILLFSISGTAAQAQSCSGMQMLRNECGNQKKAKQEQTSQFPASTLYPNATRQEPKITPPGEKESQALNEGGSAVNSGDAATAQKDLQPIADSSENAYAKAKALSGLALLKYNSGDTKGAIVLEKQAIDLNSLPNDEYFPTLYALAEMYVADEDYAQALGALDQWIQQSGKPSADAYALKGNVLYRLEKYPEAVAAIQKAKSMTDQPKDAWDQILIASYTAMDQYAQAGKVAEAALAKDPNNTQLLMTAVSVYNNAHEYDKALALLERARANGQITDETSYINMAKLYYNVALDSSTQAAAHTNARKAADVLEEGMTKGIVKPSTDTYKLLGDAYALAGDTDKANAAYDKGGLPHASATHKSGKKK